jgi:hypothetical protein
LDIKAKAKLYISQNAIFKDSIFEYLLYNLEEVKNKITPFLEVHINFGTANLFSSKTDMVPCPQETYSFVGISNSKQIIPEINYNLKTTMCSLWQIQDTTKLD